MISSRAEASRTELQAAVVSFSMTPSRTPNRRSRDEGRSEAEGANDDGRKVVHDDDDDDDVYSVFVDSSGREVVMIYVRNSRKMRTGKMWAQSISRAWFVYGTGRKVSISEICK